MKKEKVVLNLVIPCYNEEEALPLTKVGLDKKMDAKMFVFEDLKSIKISQEDLLSAIKKLAKQKESTIKTLSHI